MTYRDLRKSSRTTRQALTAPTCDDAEPGAAAALVVTFFDHPGGPGAELKTGSMIFAPEVSLGPDGVDDLEPFADEIALGIWKVQVALDDAGLAYCGWCFAMSREGAPEPTECPKDGYDQDAFVSVWQAYDRLCDQKFPPNADGERLLVDALPNHIEPL